MQNGRRGSRARIRVSITVVRIGQLEACFAGFCGTPASHIQKSRAGVRQGIVVVVIDSKLCRRNQVSNIGGVAGPPSSARPRTEFLHHRRLAIVRRARSLNDPRNLTVDSSYIPYGRQEISRSDIAAVTKALESDFLTQGPLVQAFERAVADYCGVPYSVAMNSATSALHVACLALGVGPGDRVWTTPITFVASANCALYCGATIDFVDIDPRSYNMSVERLVEKLEVARSQNTLPKVVIPVHLCGQSCDMARIRALSEEYGFRIIEDASHAIGGKYRGEPVGSCRYSDITLFSFHPVKIITTGEGGMALTRDARLAKRMRLLSNHGVTRDDEDMSQAPAGPWYYEQIELGFNYRMTDIQSALGISQLNRLDEFVATRHAIATRYDAMLAELPVTTPFQHPDSYSAFHLYVIQLRTAEISRTHREVFEEVRRRGIGVAMHYIPVYTQPYYKKLGFSEGYCPLAEQYYSAAMTLPIYPGLSEEKQERVAAVLSDAVRGS